MLRASLVAILLTASGPVLAQDLSNLDDILVQVFNGDDAAAVNEDDETATEPDDEGDDGEYEDTTPHDFHFPDDPLDPTSTTDPRSPAYIPPHTLDPDYDPEGTDKYLYGYPEKGGPEYGEYVSWYLSNQSGSYRPDGMSDSDFVEWLEDGCPDDEVHVCGAPSY